MKFFHHNDGLTTTSSLFTLKAKQQNEHTAEKPKQRKVLDKLRTKDDADMTQKLRLAEKKGLEDKELSNAAYHTVKGPYGLLYRIPVEYQEQEYDVEETTASESCSQDIKDSCDSTPKPPRRMAFAAPSTPAPEALQHSSKALDPESSEAFRLTEKLRAAEKQGLTMENASYHLVKGPYGLYYRVPLMKQEKHSKFNITSAEHSILDSSQSLEHVRVPGHSKANRRMGVTSPSTPPPKQSQAVSHMSYNTTDADQLTEMLRNAEKQGLNSTDTSYHLVKGPYGLLYRVPVTYEEYEYEVVDSSHDNDENTNVNEGSFKVPRRMAFVADEKLRRKLAFAVPSVSDSNRSSEALYPENLDSAELVKKRQSAKQSKNSKQSEYNVRGPYGLLFHVPNVSDVVSDVSSNEVSNE